MLETYTTNQSEQWDKTVKTFLKYDVYYLSGYVKAFELNGDGKAVLMYFVSEDHATRAINVVIVRSIHDYGPLSEAVKEGELFDLVTPYGYGGWLVEGDRWEELSDAYETWCCNNHIVSEFVRFHPMLENQVQVKEMYEVVGLGETVAIELKSADVIWNNFTSKNRNVIRKAIKNGIKIYNGRCPEMFEKFRLMYDRTMDKDHADAYYYFKPEFYRSILDDLRWNVQVFYAELPDGEVIASSIMIGANGYLNYHLSGSKQEYGSLAATNLLLYEAALWGCENGYKTLYLGGGVGSREDGLFKFKRAFYKGELHRFYVGRKIFDEETYEKLVEARKAKGACGETVSYFPAYRA